MCHMTSDAIHSASRILFIRTDRLGETVLNLPVVAGLKQHFPKATVTFLSRPELTPLIGQAQGVERVLAYEEGMPRWWLARAVRLALRLRPERFDLVMISNPRKDLHLATWLAGIPCRVGYDRKWGWLLNRRLPDRKALGERHEVEYNYMLVTALGLPDSIPSWRFPALLHAQDEVMQLVEQQGVNSSESLVVVHPWTSNPVKRWPVERFRAVIETLSQRLGVVPVVIGGPEEQKPGEVLLRPKRPRVVDLIGRLSVVQLAALFQRARLLVSNDSGPVHVAAAVGTPVVVLFRTEDPATAPKRWGPWGAGHTVLGKRSLEEIQVDEVMDAIRQQLARPSATRPSRGAECA